MNYHVTHSEHKESFKEVDGDCYDPRRGHQQQQQGHRHHGYNNNNHGYSNNNHGRYETYEETCEEETYMAGRNHGHGHGHGGGARRYDFETYEETSYEEEEVVVGGGGYAQLKRGHRYA